MSFRKFKTTGRPVVKIGGVAYVLDMRTRRLRGICDPDDVIDLEDELAEVE